MRTQGEFNFPLLIKASTSIRKSDYLDLDAERIRDFFLIAFKPHSLGEMQATDSGAFAFIGAPYRLAWSKWNRLSDFSYGEVKVIEIDDRWVVSFIGEPKRILSVGLLYTCCLSALFLISSRQIEFALLFGFSVSVANVVLSFLSSRYRMKRFLDKTRHRFMLAR